METEFEALVAIYLAECRRRGLRQDTVRYYAAALSCVRTRGRIATLEDFSLAALRAFQDASGLSAQSTRGYLRAAKTFARWLDDEGHTGDDRLARLRLPRVDESVVPVPTDKELVAVLKSSAPALRAVLVLLAGTGLRISDVTSLSIRDVRESELVVRTTKNRAGRQVPLDPVMAAFLARHAAGRPGVGSQSLFLTRTGRPISPGSIRLALSDAVARSGVVVRVTPHVLRHWHARDLARHGTSERLLVARMGWRTQRHGLVARYAPVDLEEIVADVLRYSPLTRLRDQGALDGLLPPSVLRSLR